MPVADPASGNGALGAVLRWLRCPHCGESLDFATGPSNADGSAGAPNGGIRTGRGVKCLAGHHFDLARQGYLSLLGPQSRTDTGDSAEMVAARVSFLGTGWYDPIADAVAQSVPAAASLVELGAGTGYYLASVLDALPDSHGLAVDSSVRAARRAAGAHPRMASVVADAWDRLPLADGSAEAVLSVFAPRQASEICRILSSRGQFVVVTPEPGHLMELIQPFRMLTVDCGKAEKIVTDFAALVLLDRRRMTFTMELSPAQIKDLVMMGPTARHLQAGEFDAALSALPPHSTVTASVTVSVLGRKGNER